MKISHSIPQCLLLGASLFGCSIGAYADVPPTSVAPQSSRAPLKGPPIPIVQPLPLQLPQSLTSAIVDYGKVPVGESVKLLEAKVSFKIKDASFLSALDAVLTSANTKCRVECRGIKAMKITLQTRDDQAGSVLDSLAKSGGARMWVFSNKLLLAPESLLTAEEKKSAKLYGVLITKDQLPAGSTLAQTVDGLNVLEAANSRIIVDLNNSSLGESTSRILSSQNHKVSITFYCPDKMQEEGWTPTTMSVALRDMNVAQALSLVASANSCNLYLVKDGFLLCAADSPEIQRLNATPAFSASSTHFNFNFTAPSAPGA